jgi:peptidoglycan-N-acetylglucosamine deacetylase
VDEPPSNAEPRRRPKPSLVRRTLRRARGLMHDALGATSFGTITSVATSEPMVALTFDDGPDPRWTPLVLDVLDAHRAKATFFVVGSSVEAHPDVVRRIHGSGHALGNHTHTHRSLPLVSGAERLRELRACAAALAPYPQPRRLFRPPHLDQDLRSRFDTWRLGYDVIACSHHARDWEDRGRDEMARTLVEGAEAGDVVMLHDALHDRRDLPRTAMIEALEILLRERGDLRFVTVPELLQAGRARREIFLRRPHPDRAAGSA